MIYVRNRMLCVALIGFAWLVGCAAARQHDTPRARPRARDYFERGEWFASRGDSVRAEQYLSMALRAGYPEAHVLRPLLAACLRASRLRAARTYAESYLLRHPRAWHVRHVLAGLHLALGASRSAQRELLVVLSDRPDHAHAHYLLGVLARDVFADDAGARQRFASYLRLEPRGAHASDAQRSLGGASASSTVQADDSTSHADTEADTEADTDADTDPNTTLAPEPSP